MPGRGPWMRSAVGILCSGSGYNLILTMVYFCRQRCPHVPGGPHTVHSGFHCQLRGAHSPPRGAVCATAAEAEVLPSQQVSPCWVEPGGGGGTSWGLASDCTGVLARPAASSAVCALGKGTPSCVFDSWMWLALCLSLCLH